MAKTKRLRRRSHKKYSNQVIGILNKRISKLFTEALQTNNQELKDRYVELAKKLSTKHKVKLSSEHKKRFCKHCKTHFTGDNLRVRTTKGKITYTCLKCKKQTRYPFYKERKEKRLKNQK